MSDTIIHRCFYMQPIMKTAGPAPKPSDKPMHPLLRASEVARNYLRMLRGPVVLGEGSDRRLFTSQDVTDGRQVLAVYSTPREAFAYAVAAATKERTPIGEVRYDVYDVETGRYVSVRLAPLQQPIQIFAAAEPKTGA